MYIVQSVSTFERPFFLPEQGTVIPGVDIEKLQSVTLYVQSVSTAIFENLFLDALAPLAFKLSLTE